MSASNPGPLGSVRVIESSLLGPGELTSFLADLGADVIKVEPPQGDYIRRMTWPIVEGESPAAPKPEMERYTIRGLDAATAA